MPKHFFENQPGSYLFVKSVCGSLINVPVGRKLTVNYVVNFKKTKTTK